VLYGLNLLMAALAYYVLQLQLSAHHGPGNAIEQALGRDLKGKASPLIYLAGMAAAWWMEPWLGFAAFAAAALIWLVPDRRMERAVNQRKVASRSAGSDSER
jgi:uncharacterized membrane protein